jgi:hypothetical protein
MSLGKAIAQAVAGGLAGYATVATNKDFLNPVLSGIQAGQERDARAKEKAGDRAFAAEQGALDRQARVASQQSQQEFQARLQFAEQQAVLMGDFGAYGKVLGELGVPEAAAVASMAAAGGQFAEKADAKARAQWTDNSSATLGALEQVVNTSPSKALDQIDLARQRIQGQVDSATRVAATDGTKGVIASLAQEAWAKLGTLEEQANTGVLTLEFQSGEFTSMADGAPTQRVQRALAAAGYGPDSAANESYNSVASIRGQLGNLANVSLDDVQDPGIRAMLSRFQDEDNPPPSTLIGLAGQDPKVAADVLRDLQGITKEQLSNEAQQLGRLNSRRDFDARLAVGLDSAAKYAGGGVDFALPESTFVQQEDGTMRLSAEGADSLASMFRGQFPGDEQGTMAALEAVDDFTEAAGLTPEATNSVSQLIAKDHKQLKETYLNLQDPAEQIAKSVERDFNRIPPDVAAALRSDISGMGTNEAREYLRARGIFRKKDLDLIKSGGQIYGRSLVQAVIPTGKAVEEQLASIQGALFIAETAGDTAKVAALTAKQRQLMELRDPKASSVANQIENTLFDITRAVATDDLDGLYDSITLDLRTKGLEVTFEGSDEDAKKQFKAKVKTGSTEGARIANAIEWINDKQLFRLGSSGQPTTAAEQEFSNYLTSVRHDYAALVDDTLADLDLDMRFRKEDGVLYDTYESRPSAVALRYLTSGPADYGEFTATTVEGRIEEYQRLQQYRTKR